MPSLPGVYWFTDEVGNILYVGKAKSLKNRIYSYTQVNRHHPRTFKLVTTAKKINFKSLDSELEAILTEAELIKLHQPPYNVLLKDDKSPLYLILTKEDFPRLLAVRKKTLSTIYTNLPDKNIFGPFSSSLTTKTIIKLARKTFKFCNASPVQKQTKKPCFYTHLNLCSGACAGWVSKQEYNQMISNMKLFLRGKKKTLGMRLKNQMHLYSQEKLFEKAASVRDQLTAIETLYTAGRGAGIDTSLPFIEKDITLGRVSALRKILHETGLIPSTYPLKRLEAYDISNTSQTNCTASMVVFIDGKPDTAEYRHFGIKYTTSGGDPAMMKEVLVRRLNHPEWDYPNLFIIDGGRTQLKAALSVIGTSIPTISIVKGPDRLLIPKLPPHFNGVINQKTPITFIEVHTIEGEGASSLVQQIRDEAHRFAKGYHSHLRAKSLLSGKSVKQI